MGEGAAGLVEILTQKVIPIEQGLKPILDPLNRGQGRTQKVIPIEQGLKPHSATAACRASYYSEGHSNRTRIETRLKR